MTKLTSRERLHRCFHHEELDRPGIYVRTGFPSQDSSYDALRTLLLEKTDMKFRFHSGQYLEPLPIQTSDEPHSEDFLRRFHRLQTPAGELVSIEMISLKGQPNYTEKHFLSDRQDAERFLSLPMPQIRGDISEFFKLDAQADDRGIVDIGLALNPAGQVAELFGSENFALMTLEDREILHELCQRQMQIMLRLLDFLVAHKVGPFFSMLGEEFIVPPLHGRRDFFDFNVRYDKPIVDLIHEAGGRLHIHSHGPIKTVLDGFLEIGMDVLHPIEPPPMGDLTAQEAKERLRGKVCIEGNIQIADLYEKTPEQVRAQTEALIQSAFDDRRDLIVCPSASPYIFGAGEQCYQQFNAMIDAVLTWRS